MAPIIGVFFSKKNKYRRFCSFSHCFAQQHFSQLKIGWFIWKTKTSFLLGPGDTWQLVSQVLARPLRGSEIMRENSPVEVGSSLWPHYLRKVDSTASQVVCLGFLPWKKQYLEDGHPSGWWYVVITVTTMKISQWNQAVNARGPATRSLGDNNDHHGY